MSLFICGFASAFAIWSIIDRLAGWSALWTLVAVASGALWWLS